MTSPLAAALVASIQITAHNAIAQPPRASPFDGHYFGQATTVGNSAPNCHWNPHQLVVHNGQISRPVAGAPVSAAIAPDGSFIGSGTHQTPRGDTVTVLFNGRITQGVLEGTVQTPRCTYHLSYQMGAGPMGAGPMGAGRPPHAQQMRPQGEPPPEEELLPPEPERPPQ